jgi:hypothetical protein
MARSRAARDRCLTVTVPISVTIPIRVSLSVPVPVTLSGITDTDRHRHHLPNPHPDPDPDPDPNAHPHTDTDHMRINVALGLKRPVQPGPRSPRDTLRPSTWKITIKRQQACENGPARNSPVYDSGAPEGDGGAGFVVPLGAVAPFPRPLHHLNCPCTLTRE